MFVAHLIHGIVAGYRRPHVYHVLVLWVVWRHVETRRKLHAVDNSFLEKSRGGGAIKLRSVNFYGVVMYNSVFSRIK